PTTSRWRRPTGRTSRASRRACRTSSPAPTYNRSTSSPRRRRDRRSAPHPRVRGPNTRRGDVSELSAQLPQLKQPLAALAGFEQALTPYIMAVVEIPTGPRQGQLDGGTFTYDPLAGLPALERQLTAAKQHAMDFVLQVGQPLHVWTIFAVPTFND